MPLVQSVYRCGKCYRWLFGGRVTGQVQGSRLPILGVDPFRGIADIA